MVEVKVGLYRTCIIVSLLFIIFFLPKQSNLTYANVNSTYSLFQITQNPSERKIPVCTEILIQLTPSVEISSEIDRVLLFYHTCSITNMCCTEPIYMSKNSSGDTFYASLIPEEPNSELRYRFIIYFSNGTPICFPNSIESEIDPNVIQGETGLYYYLIEIVECEINTEEVNYVFILPIISLSIIVLFKRRKITNF